MTRKSWGPLGNSVPEESLASKLVLDLSWPSTSWVTPVPPLSSTLKSSSSGLKFRPVTKRVLRSTEGSAVKISGARGVGVGVPVKVGVAVGVVGVLVGVTLGVGGVNGR